MLDTLRKDAFDRHFDWLPGTRYENAWSTSHWTVPAHGSLFTGKYASEVGVHAKSQIFDCPEPSLTELLSNSGYTTRAFSANPNISKSFGFDRGFDEFEGSWRLDAIDGKLFDWDGFIDETRGEGPTRFLKAFWRCVTGNCSTLPSLKHGAALKMRDQQVGSYRDEGATTALELVRSTEFGDQEFFFLNLMEAHTPYNPPKEYQTVEPPQLDGLKATLSTPEASPERIRNAYDDSVRYLSDMYELIFAELREDFDYVITLSDHGELLGEHDAWEHLYGIYPELIHVPLSIYGDGHNEEACEETVSLIDVYRTVLELAEIEVDGRGRNLTSELVPTEWLTEYHGVPERNRKSLEANGFTDIDWLDGELHGLAAPETYYGYETFDGFEESGTAMNSSPRERLEKMVAELEKREVDTDVEYSDSVMKQLEDLGYA